MEKIQKNDELELVIEDITTEGEGVGKINGLALFVKDAIIGDKVKVKVMKMKKNYGYARLMEIVEPSFARTEPVCPVARQCGGCQLQHMKYEEQLKYKENKVKNCLERIGGISFQKEETSQKEENFERVEKDFEKEDKTFESIEESLKKEDKVFDRVEGRVRKENNNFKKAVFEPIIGMEEPFYYRNKAQFPVGKNKDSKIVMGFYAGRTHSIIDTPHCYIQAKENEQLLQIVREFMEENQIEPYNEETHTGLVRHVLTRVGFTTGEIMVCLIINGETLPKAEQLVEKLKVVKGMTSICLNVNKEKTNVILGNKVKVLWGQGYITDYIGDIKYQISPLSFYQVNPVQTKKLYEIALEYAGLTGNEVVWDLYCGIGTISLFLAKNAKKVYGVEIVPQAIEDAKKNAEINNIENAEFFVGAAEEILPQKYKESNGQMKAQVIVVDPPRKGCDEKLLETIVKMEPERIVYVSCDPATLARDLKYLEGKEYKVEKVRACDMFGHSVHVETVVLMSKVR